MAVFCDWKLLNEIQVLTLELENDPQNIRRLLEEYMRINFKDQRKRDVAVDFHLHNYIFCKDQAFDGRRTSAFMSIMSETLASDAASYSPAHTRLRSFQAFQSLILKHSIERSPISIQVFTEDDVIAIMKFVVDSYYRQYNMYKFVFSCKLRLTIKQSLPQEIEQPSFAILPLNSGFLVSNPHSADGGSIETASPASVS